MHFNCRGQAPLLVESDALVFSFVALAFVIITGISLLSFLRVCLPQYFLGFKPESICSCSCVLPFLDCAVSCANLADHIVIIIIL